jgi:hypothetical protein
MATHAISPLPNFGNDKKSRIPDATANIKDIAPNIITKMKKGGQPECGDPRF